MWRLLYWIPDVCLPARYARQSCRRGAPVKFFFFFSFHSHSQRWRLGAEGATIVSAVTLKHFKRTLSARQRRAGCLSHSERAITQPDNTDRHGSSTACASLSPDAPLRLEVKSFCFRLVLSKFPSQRRGRARRRFKLKSEVRHPGRVPQIANGFY